MRWISALLLYSLMPQPSAWGAEITLRIGIHRIRADISNTPQSRERGLMQHTRLCENCGMLFVFPKNGRYGFWMKDTPLPLSIAFIAADGKIKNIAEMQADSLDIHAPKEEILYALEMPKGWFSRHGVNAEDRVDGLQYSLPGL